MTRATRRSRLTSSKITVPSSTPAEYQVRRLQDELSTSAKTIEVLRSRLAVLEKLNVECAPARWASKPPKIAHSSKAVPFLLLSDLHFDEVVKPEQIEGVNEYNRAIALRRFQRVINTAIEFPFRYLRGLNYEGLELGLGGDIFNGDIHEGRATNADTLFGGFDYWIGHLQTSLLALADCYKHLHVTCITGNHGRNTDKPIFKNRARDNIEWLLYRQLAKLLVADSRITWNIPESPDADIDIYGSRLRFTHGDRFRGGSGISGILTPLMLGMHREQQRRAAVGKPFDHMVVCHFHQRMYGPGLMVNGSLKGYCEFAGGHGFRYERPQQILAIFTPEQGLSFPLSIFADDKPFNQKGP